MAGGDVVRNLRQVIDLCQQIADVAPNPDTRRTGQLAVESAMRGIIRDAVSGERLGGGAN